MWHAWLLSGVLIEEGERVVAMAEHHARCAQTHAALVGVARRGVSRRYARRVASASVAWRRAVFQPSQNSELFSANSEFVPFPTELATLQVEFN